MNLFGMPKPEPEPKQLLPHDMEVELKELKGYNKTEKIQLLRIIEELVPATESGKNNWNLNHDVNNPYPCFITSTIKWKIEIIKYVDYFEITVRESYRGDPGDNVLLSESFHDPGPHPNTLTTKNYHLCKRLWNAIVRQPENLKNEVDGIVNFIRKINND